MSARKKPDQRCPTCLMRFEFCLCSSIPKLITRTHLLLVTTAREYKRPTNTGRLAAQSLQSSQVCWRGIKDQTCDIASMQIPGYRSILLYPDADAELLSADTLESEQPIQLVVLDGNWRQTSKMPRRDPFLASLPRFRLQPENPSQYQVRTERKTEGLATIEAIARAMEILEGPETRQALEGIMHKMVLNTLRSRGSGDYGQANHTQAPFNFEVLPVTTT